MALINCPECNKSISDKATSCPHCGCPLQTLQQPVNVPPEVPTTPKTASTFITIWGANPSPLWDLDIWHIYMDVDGVRFDIIPWSGKYVLEIDRDCTLTFSINNTKPVSYAVSVGNDETIQLSYSTAWGGLSIKGQRGNVEARGCSILTFTLISSITTLTSILIMFLFN